MSKWQLAFTISVSALALLARPAAADEGLWTIDSFPVGRVKTVYGASISKAWLGHVQAAAVRLTSDSGCSASLVSAQGLVLTNNHCVLECAQDVSDPQHNRYADGFVATDAADERRCGKLSADVVMSVADVTKDIARAEAGLAGSDRARAHGDAIARLQKAACLDDVDDRCEVSEFYRGAQYKLIKYRSYRDVRLVFSPGATASSFEGPRFPPYSFDAAFLRVYDHDQPAATPHHLRWTSNAPRQGELTFLAGSPRISERELTVAQLKNERDLLLPDEQIRSSELIGRLVRFGEESAANRAASEYQLWDLQNHFGYTLDLTKTLRDEALFARKVADEADLSAKGGPLVQAQLKAIDNAERMRKVQAASYQYLVEGPSSELFNYARLLVRGAIERAKPQAERTASYADDQIPLREQQVLAARPVFEALEQLQLEFWLDGANRYLDDDPSTKQTLLDGSTPDALSTQLATSRLADAAFRRQLWTGGLAAVEASMDPMIQYVLRIDPAARALHATWQETVTGPENSAAAALARARLAVLGAAIYPDANLTLRLNVGQVDGHTDGGRQHGPFTTFGDFSEYVRKQGDAGIDKRWLAAKDLIDPKTVFTFSTTNDGINGNSGSPILNQHADVIGVFFGGNHFAMGGNYLYDPLLNRAVAVSTGAIYQAVRTIYRAKRLAEELEASSREPSFAQ